MRTWPGLGLLLLATLLIQVSTAEDLYWEGEEDTSNEFLEVKEDSGLVDHLKRLKRAWPFDPFNLFSSSTTVAPEKEVVTADPDDYDFDNKDDENHGEGSGSLPETNRIDTDVPGEKTLRVTFVVVQPYQVEYSNRDSPQFQQFSKTLAQAVDRLFDYLPGTQKASLIRIQSRLDDNFSCKVTLDIVTIGYDDTGRITETLRNHIRDYRYLSEVSVSEEDFSANVVNPGSAFETCQVSEIQCRDGTCVSGDARCNGRRECADGSDEHNCPTDVTNQVKQVFQTDQQSNSIDSAPTQANCANPIPCASSSVTICPEQRCDGIAHCPSGDDEHDCGTQTRGPERGDQPLYTSPPVDIDQPETPTPTPYYPPEFSCPAGEFRCDDTRCILKSQLCDQTNDCFDGTDEANCPKSCGAEDFRCNDGRCIESQKKCDRVTDCRDGEDEADCACGTYEFQCARDGACIEGRKRCDGVTNCRDGTDELDCGEARCPVGSFTCDPGSVVQCATRCDNILECENAEDEDGCLDCAHECDGRCLDERLICNGRPDCSDGSDEEACQTCDGPDDFRCLNGECIKASQRCNGAPECSDESDELNCNDTMRPTYEGCQENQFKCHDGTCINHEFLCDQHDDCNDGSDEQNCPCRQDEFQCLSLECVSLSDKCDGKPDCRDGSDESPDQCQLSPGPGYTTEYQYPPPNPASRPVYTTTERADDRYSPFAPDNRPASRYPTYASVTDREPVDLTTRYTDRYDPYQTTDSEKPSYPPSNSAGGDNTDQNVVPGSGDNDRDNSETTPSPNGWYDPYEQGSSYSPATGNGNSVDRPIDVNSGGYPYDPSAASTSAPAVGGSSGDPYGNGGYPSGGSPGQGGQSSYPSQSGGRPWSGSQSGGSVRGPVTLNIKTYPTEQSVRFGGDVVFQCRDESSLRASVRWVREGGKRLKPGHSDRNGRLELYQVTGADSGVYICQSPGYLGKPGSEVRVTLTVENNRAPQARPDFVPCKPYEATCGNGDCILKSAVCDGKIDCSDRSDEDMCTLTGMCEPNQFQCENRKCVLKTWLCDSENDCGDGSDEQNCGPQRPGQPCLVSEFSCATGAQCIPKSFHCDGRSDCFDKSDEVGCAPVYIVKPPSPSNIRLNVGDTLVLRAEAKGNPVPVISWRLNWGHVPPQCTSTSEDGVGVLTCPNMRPEHSGAYSAEALNNKGTTFANPDAIVFVTQTSPCPAGYFNNEARSEQECIRCFCFGESTQCRSADLFTYNMPTPLGQGGTRLQGVTVTPEGEVRTDASITNHYYYQPLRNGATVTKLVSFDESSLGSFHPYLTLPETYNGQQLTSYGGHIKYTLAPHAKAYEEDETAPTIIVKGKYATLFHFNRDLGISVDIPVDVRLTPENWRKPGPYGYEQASREDIMMALDQVDTILLRADRNNAGVNISNFVMESAQHINIGLGAASLVEECTCPPGYEGLSCQKCAAGYVREKSGPWLGNCVREACPAGTYGDPASGRACQPCPCPLTNRANQFATTCSLGPDGSVACDCFTGYEGKNCDVCAPGYQGNPMVQGDSCRPAQTPRCNGAGTETARLLDDCVCKENVQGRYCDECKNNSFYLSNDFRYGCALCFCSGVSQQCMSSNLRRKTTSVNFNVPNIVDQVKVYNSALAGVRDLRYGAPVETDIKPVLTRGGLTIKGQDNSRPTVYYWSMPLSFTNDKVTSYGGYMRYTLENVPSYVDPRASNTAADVQLISENRLTFQFTGDFRPSPEGVLNASVQFLETAWHRSDGQEVSREHFLLALADVKAILIKATYGANSVATPLWASIETAEPGGEGPAALHVEQCVCPAGYVGTSCEDCAPGYTRSSSGLYLEHCGLCDCNGHSRQCHPETGQCYGCMDNTDGAHCESCKPGYVRDEYENCVEPVPATCPCDPRGSSQPCDADGQCHCKANVEGKYCDRCRAGTFGLAASNPDGCIACFCSGATQECQEANYYTRIPMAAPIFGDDYGGYKLTDLNAETVINDQFVPIPDKSELMYVFSDPPVQELYWSLPVFPGNRVTSYGGSLSLRQEFKSNSYDAESVPGVDVVLAGDHVSLYWTNPNQLRSGVSLSYQVPLVEHGWFRLGTVVPASRSDLMHVLKSLRRVLVRATVAQNIVSSTIADVSMDTATESFQPGAPVALGVEICTCPQGHLGTSCESCAAGYYKDEQDYCTQCPCSGHDCQLDAYGHVTCNCRPPYTGPDCSAIVGEPQVTTVRPVPPQTTVTVRITSPTIKIQEVGSSVNFTCQAQSRINTNRLLVTWTKADGFLPQDRTYVDRYSGLLKITNLQITDSGVYICQTNDGISTGQAQVTLKVPANEMMIPTVFIKPLMSEYYEDDRIVLECVANGKPAPAIFWKRSSRRPLPISSHSSGGTFIIDRAREEDSGEYSCIATNTLGSSENIAVINVRPRPSRPPRDRLMVSPTAPVVLEGQSTMVVCTGSTSVPTGTIDWVRQDNGRFQANVRSDNGVLYIDGATMENQGVYLCRTHAAEVDAVPVLVTITPVGTPPPGEEPNITVPVTQMKIPSGESGTVDCTPSGYPLPQIRWSRYQGEFGAGASQRGDMLIINNAQESDQGYYVCEGLNNGQLIKNIYVYVEIEKREAPRVQIWPEGEQPVTLGNAFEFHCRVLGGVPEPDVTWSRSGSRALSPTTEIKPNNILRFEKVDVNDEGEYICSGSNIVGSASASAVVKVRAPPEINLTPSSYITVRNGDPISMECRANGYPEPMVSIRGPNRRELAPATPGIATIRISSASSHDDGEYTCKATSAAGTLEEPFEIRVERGDGGDGLADYDGSGDIDIHTQGPEPYDPNSDPGPYDPYNPDYSQPQPPRPSDLVVQDGQPKTEIDCFVSRGFGVRWNRSDRQPMQRNAVQEGNKLLIYNVSKSDSGEYVCSMFNSQTNDVQTARYVTLLVVRPPRITLRPPTQTVHPGQSPTVECVVEGDNILDIHWSPYNRSPSRRVEIRNSTLIFHHIEVEDAGEYVCFATNQYANASARAEVIVADPRQKTVQLVKIVQPGRRYSTGENVEILCRAERPDVNVNWEKYGTRQYVDVRRYRDGAMLIVHAVTINDAGVYRCTAVDPYGHTSYDDFSLEVEPGNLNPSYPRERNPVATQSYTAHLRDSIEMPCNHDLEEPVNIKWRRLYSQLPSDARSDQPILLLSNVNEGDAGTYVCRVSNNRAAVETRAILRVVGVVPSFGGESWIALPTIKDAYRQFDIEVSFKPSDGNGLILYNSQFPGRTGDYLALQLEEGVPQFIMETGNGPVYVKGDRPLQLNIWHTIRLSRIGSRVTMDVDNIGPFANETAENWVLDLQEPLYIGGVRDLDSLPAQLAGASGFVGCVSMLILGHEEKNIMMESVDQNNIEECDSCYPNLCLNEGVCQEARNERGYICICANGFAGQNCDRRGEACHPGLCGYGKCTDTPDGYKCACPVTHTGRNCEETQSIEYPAFTGSAYLALKPPNSFRFLKMAMKVKATSPVQDGIIMYCAESPRGLGGFTSLAVRNKRLEFRYDLNEGTPVVLVSNTTLPAGEWTDVQITRSGQLVSLNINVIHNYEQRLDSANKSLKLETPMFVGGVDETITLNNNTGVTGGFSGCIKDVKTQGNSVNIVNSSIQSANVQECSNNDRGDIPAESENPSCSCANGATCNSDGSCSCPTGFTGYSCEIRVGPAGSRRAAADPCAARPCQNGGTCRVDYSNMMNHSCDCPLGFAGTSCQMQLHLYQSVGFNGNGYLELPANLIRYESEGYDPSWAIIALAVHTTQNGVLLYQTEMLQRDTEYSDGSGDFVLIRIDRGHVVLEWDMGSGVTSLTIDSKDGFVTDGERHQIIVKFVENTEMKFIERVELTVDGSTVVGETNGMANRMGADSNIYIGGIPDRLNVAGYPGLIGCVEQIEFMAERPVVLGDFAVAGRNTQRCREP